jgi:hypothetical protein
MMPSFPKGDRAPNLLMVEGVFDGQVCVVKRMRLSSLRTCGCTTNERCEEQENDALNQSQARWCISEVPIREDRLLIGRQGKTLQDWLCTDCKFVDE